MVNRRKSPLPEPPKSKPDEPLTEVGRTDAARFLGASVASIKRWEKDGVLDSRIDSAGIHWFSMASLERFKAERAGEPSPEVEKIVATIEGATTHAKDAGKHTERILDLVLDPSESLLKLYQETCKDLRDELTKTRGELFELLQKMGEVLRAQRQEDIEQRRIELSDARKGQALGLVKQAIPLLIAQAGGNKQLGQLLSFVQSMHPDQLRILLDSGLLTQAQIQALSLVLTEDQQRGLAERPSTDEQETPVESKPDAP